MKNVKLRKCPTSHNSDRMPMATLSCFLVGVIIGSSLQVQEKTLPKSLREFLRADNGDLILFIKEHDIIPGKAKCS